MWEVRYLTLGAGSRSKPKHPARYMYLTHISLPRPLIGSNRTTTPTLRVLSLCRVAGSQTHILPFL